MSTLILMRHGQARFGDAEYDRLTTLGAQQAEATGAFFTRTQARFDAVYVGPKRRHHATAAAAAAGLDHAPAPELAPALDEFAEASAVLDAAGRAAGLAPDALHALPRAEQLRRYGALIAAWMEGRAEIAGCPTAAQFRDAVARWLRAVVARPGRGERLLAVTSAGVVAAAVAETLGLPVSGMAQLIRVVRNASLTEIEFSPGRVSLMSFNSVAHLPPALATSM